VAAHRSLLIVVFANLVLFGAGVSLLGATMPIIIRDFSWSYLETGSVLAVSSAAYLASTFLCGLLVRRLGPRAVVVGGLLVQGAGMAAFGSHPGLVWNMAAWFLVGLGEGGTEVVSNYCVVRIERTGQSRIMNLMHSAFTVGAVLGPVVVGSVLQAELPWRYAYLGVGASCAGAALAFSLVDFGDAGLRLPATRSASSALVALARNPLLILLCLVILLYVGVEIGVASWVAEYFVEVHGLSVAAAAYSVSVFWGGLLCGRFLAWAAYHGHRQERFLLVLTITAALGVGLAVVADTPMLAMALFFVGGLGCSCVYPVVMTIAGLRFTEEQSLAIGAVSTAGGLGSLACPYIMSGIAERFGVADGFWFYGAVTAAMVLAALAVPLLARRGNQPGGNAPGSVSPNPEVSP